MNLFNYINNHIYIAYIFITLIVVGVVYNSLVIHNIKKLTVDENKGKISTVRGTPKYEKVLKETFNWQIALSIVSILLFIKVRNFYTILLLMISSLFIAKTLELKKDVISTRLSKVKSIEYLPVIILFEEMTVFRSFNVSLSELISTASMINKSQMMDRILVKMQSYANVDDEESALKILKDNLGDKEEVITFIHVWESRKLFFEKSQTTTEIQAIRDRKLIIFKERSEKFRLKAVIISIIAVSVSTFFYAMPVLWYAVKTALDTFR